MFPGAGCAVALLGDCPSVVLLTFVVGEPAPVSRAGTDGGCLSAVDVHEGIAAGEHFQRDAVGGAIVTDGIELVLLEVDAQFPSRAGLGSSAALAVAVARVAAAACAHETSGSDFDAAVHEAETIFHGNPSGIDAAAAKGGGAGRFARATGWQIAIAGRAQSNLRVGRWRSEGSLLEIGMNELRLDAHECDTMARAMALLLVQSRPLTFIERPYLP